MGVIGVSLIVVSFVYVLACPIGWLPRWIVDFKRGLGGAPAITEGPLTSTAKAEPGRDEDARDNTATSTARDEAGSATETVNRKAQGSREMPPPPRPMTAQQPPAIKAPSLPESTDEEEQITPKAAPAESKGPVPTFSLSDDAPSKPSRAPSASAWASTMPSSSSSAMPPPPRPNPQPPRLPQFPAANSPQIARGPAPDRGPPAGGLAPPSGGLAPPPTLAAKPNKPSKKVMLQPGRSPLDWARISGPSSDLRNLPPNTPYLRVTPSMLKAQNGRKGTDAWMALNGKVYNISPYAEYHPGGKGELMRGAGKDGTKLYGEIHPWVNYETMMAACLIGLLVDEPDGKRGSEMDEMD
ncbi:uncharacterized protein F5Z01DRAFT_670876 [Emericellopsis atlantica]|uniref:Cytochrome b5 heme-binding domain-containing protein n=1 Tax=Emericellopsis atlantica TaxID=2614577 RepID=A0A9P7ZTS7_9HYPO|nr:uncharacterized protein F5Z01DRAFT_670876 [Emericellopsis atlantica]KAG9258229.1 hypothetical protein F5Z01DRAFT_670876 [Emericellopsis atlantica]